MCVLNAVLVVSQLVRLSDVLVTFGLTLENVMLPFLFVILPFLSFTIPVAYLFAVLLAFSRLSSDGEYTALQAAGYSLARAAKPVFALGLVLYLFAAVSSLWLEPWGRREFLDFYRRKAQTELDNLVKYKMQSGVFLDDFLGFVLYAERISEDRTRFENLMLAPGPGFNTHNFTLLSPSGSIFGSVEDGDLRMSFDYGVVYSTTDDTNASTIVKFKRAEIDILKIFQKKIFGTDSDEDDYRSYSPAKLLRFIDEAKKNRDESDRSKKVYLESRFLFHQRTSLPFATFIFALFAMVLGVQDPRRGKSMAYVGSLGTIMVSYIILMGFKWMAERGHIPAPVSAWAPNVIISSFGAFLFYQKNRLPPSEGTLDPRNIPWLAKFTKGTATSK